MVTISLLTLTLIKIKSHPLNDVVKLFSVLCCARQLSKSKMSFARILHNCVIKNVQAGALSLSFNNGKGGKQKLCTMKSEVQKYFPNIQNYISLVFVFDLTSTLGFWKTD